MVLPAGGPWQRLAVIYQRVAELVAAADEAAVVISGDCTTSLGVLAGVQRTGRDPGIVWFDAHADFLTEATTTSGYLGGVPIALAAGVGTLTLPAALGLRPVPQSRIVLVDRDVALRPTRAGAAHCARRPATDNGQSDQGDGW